MNRLEIRRDVRAAIAMAYELSRHAHVQEKLHIASALADLEFELTRIEAKLGGPSANEAVPGRLDPALAEVREVVSDAGSVVAAQLRALMGSVKTIQGELLHLLPTRNILSRPVLGAFPLARRIPQDAHSIGDYLVGAGALATLLVASTGRAKATGLVLGLGAIGLALFTDHRLGARKSVAIEAHQKVDYAWGAAAIAAPFVLGYAKRDPIATAIHVGLGASLIAASTITDYRAATGVGHATDEEADPQFATVA